MPYGRDGRHSSSRCVSFSTNEISNAHWNWIQNKRIENPRFLNIWVCFHRDATKYRMEIIFCHKYWQNDLTFLWMSPKLYRIVYSWQLTNTVYTQHACNLSVESSRAFWLCSRENKYFCQKKILLPPLPSLRSLPPLPSLPDPIIQIDVNFEKDVASNWNVDCRNRQMWFSHFRHFHQFRVIHKWFRNFCRWFHSESVIWSNKWTESVSHVFDIRYLGLNDQKHVIPEITEC